MSPTSIIDESGLIADWYLVRLEDEAIDGVDICPDDVLLIIDRLRKAEKERDQLKEREP